MRVELIEQLVDDLGFVFEMVIEVAGADVKLVRNLQSRHVRLAMLVEQVQAGMQYTISGFHAALKHSKGKERAEGEERDSYAPAESPKAVNMTDQCAGL